MFNTLFYIYSGIHIGVQTRSILKAVESSYSAFISQQERTINGLLVSRTTET